MICFERSTPYKEMVRKVVAFKKEYQKRLEELDSFESRFLLQEYIKETRDKFYSLDLKECMKDKLWEYMNDDVDYYVLLLIR